MSPQSKSLIGMGFGFVAFMVLLGTIGHYYGPPVPKPTQAELKPEQQVVPSALQLPQEEQQQQQQQQPQQVNASTGNCEQKGQALDQAVQGFHDQASHDQAFHDTKTALKAMELGMALRGVGPCADANGNLPP